MRRILALIALLSPSWVLAAEAESTDAVDQELRACLLDSNRNASCFQGTLAKYLPPKNEEAARIALQIDDLLKKWLGGDKVFAVHYINSVKTGNLFERRAFLLEDSSGALAVVQFSTIRRLGKLYVLNFRFTSTTSEVEQLLYGR